MKNTIAMLRKMCFLSCLVYSISLYAGGSDRGKIGDVIDSSNSLGEFLLIVFVAFLIFALIRGLFTKISKK